MSVDHDRLAALLWSAGRLRRPIATLTGADPSVTMEDAYRIRDAVLRRRLAAGERIVGAKLGFTSRAMREQMGIDRPNYGWLTDAMLLDGPRLDLAAFIHPRVEPEIAFRLGAPLRGPGVGVAEVLEATEAVLPALEIVDTRFNDYRFRLEDNTADNSSAAAVRLGAPSPVDGLDLRLLGVVLERDGHVVDTAAGAAAMGDPAAAVAWLANELADGERALEAGDVVISGGLVRAVPIGRGERIAAHFDRLGSVELLAARRPVPEVVA